MKSYIFSYVFLSSVFIILSKIVGVTIIGAGNITDTFFFAAACSQPLSKLCVGALQNSWLHKLSNSNDSSIMIFFGESLRTNIKMIVINMLIILPFTYISSADTILKNEYIIYFIYFSIGSSFQLFSTTFQIIEFSKKNNLFVEKLEFISTLLYVFIFLTSIFLEKYILLASAFFLKNALVSCVFFLKNKFSIKFYFNSLFSKQSSNLNTFIYYGSPSKLFPLVDKFIFSYMSSGILTIFSIWDSLSSTGSRILWRTFGLTQVPNQSILIKSSNFKLKKINTLIFTLLITLILTSLSLYFLSYFQFRVPFNLLNLSDELSSQFWLIGIIVLPILFLSLPLGLVQHGLYAFDKEKDSVLLGLLLSIVLNIIKLIFFFKLGILAFFVVVFLNKIVNLLFYYLFLKKQIII